MELKKRKEKQEQEHILAHFSSAPATAALAEEKERGTLDESVPYASTSIGRGEAPAVDPLRGA